MIVRDLDVVSVAFAPDEADAPLVVDPHAVLTSTIAAQGLQAIPRRHPKIFHAASTVEHQQFLARSSAHVRTSPFTGTSSKTALVRLSAKDLITTLRSRITLVMSNVTPASAARLPSAAIVPPFLLRRCRCYVLLRRYRLTPVASCKRPPVSLLMWRRLSPGAQCRPSPPARRPQWASAHTLRMVA